MAKSVGIKELKDRASSIVEEVEKRKCPIVITRNNKEVAKIVPLLNSPMERLRDLGLISSEPKLGWDEIELHGPGHDASRAIQAVLEERNQS